ncbi:MFS transporter [Pseudomaricurvus alkylphenolicus]|uniref:MFS transporter n=1 Tax=Pseudomaricurvus alkylphenolicus TaxID=1306991 RepID=UPI0030B8C5D9
MSDAVLSIDGDRSGAGQRALMMATLAFAANFSVWVLYAVIGLELQQTLDLSATQLGFLFAAPMLTGALMRIPAGLLADRYNPKHLFTLQMLITCPALFFLPWMQSVSDYTWLGFWLGISGASFTIGIRYVSDWFSRDSQGTVMGIFGAGNAGAAITLALAPVLIDRWGWDAMGPFYGVGLLLMSGLFALFAPTQPRSTRSLEATSETVGLHSLAELRHLRVWRFGLYYYFVFGSFLALIMWLPQYYVNAYQLSFDQAMAFTLVFATSSSMVRALGGWFSDRYGGRAVNWSVFWICIACLFFLSYPPTTMTIHGVEKDVHLQIEVNVWLFSFLIFVIGIAQGFGRASVYKIIHDYYPRQMGTIGGFVAALGALGGCTLPIAFGLAVDAIGVHSACFMLLYGVLACCMVVMFFANKADRFHDRLQYARAHNFLEQE